MTKKPATVDTDLAIRTFMQSLTPEQQKVAIVDKEAYKDILTTNSRQAALKGQPGSGRPVRSAATAWMSRANRG